MKESDYLRLITEAYYETIFIVGTKLNGPRNEVRKKLFLQILTRNQKKAQKRDFTTIEEFTFQCDKAVQMLQIYCEKHISTISKNLLTQEEIDDINNGFYYIDVSSLFPETVTKKNEIRTCIYNILCIKDIKFIKKWFQDFSFDEPEPNPLNLSEPSKIESNIIIVKEQYGEMFLNNGYKLFEHILSEYIKPKNTTGRYEDLSYHFRCLFEDKFIHQKPEPFRLWFNKKYAEDFSKIKTKIQTTSTQRKKDYSNALDWFNRQNK